MIAASRRNGLADLARGLLALHVPGRPLVLPNAWDAASARAVEAAGFPAVATASAAVSASLGYPDGEGTPVSAMLAAIERVARSVTVPVTADVEGGYGLPAADLVAMLLEAGAVGCTIEDTAHPGGGLIDESGQSDRIAALRDAARSAGVPIVINARVDSFESGAGTFSEQADDALRRARRYRTAGADCIYPIMLADEPTIAMFVAELDGMINAYASPAAPRVARLAELGVARVSFGPWIHRLAMREVQSALRDVASGGDPYAGRLPPSGQAPPPATPHG